MIRILSYLILVLVWLCTPAHAQFNGCSSFCGTSSSAIADAPGFNNFQNSSSGGATCSPGAAATNFLARTSGLSATETTAYCNMINGLVTDGIITGNLSGAAGCGSVLDALYILATNNTTTAALNLCGTSFSLVTHGSPTFAADVGYTGDGTAAYLDTQYAPSTNGVNFTQNGASMGVYIQSTRTAANTSVIMGVANGVFTYASPGNTGQVFTYELQGSTFPSVSTASAPGIQGAWAWSRTSSSAIALYKNGSSTAVGSSGADTSNALATSTITILALDNAGTPANFSSDQASAAFAGGTLTGVQAAAINNRINAYMTALAHNVY